MALDTITLEHICKVVRRQVQEEIRNLTLMFIVHNTGGRARALQSKMHEIREHPAGFTLWPELKQIANERDHNSQLAGISFASTKKIFGLGGQRLAFAAFYMNVDEFTDQNDARQQSYHLAWHALSLLENYKKKEKENFIEENDVLRPRHTPESEARCNMLADVFAAIMLELQGHKKSTSALAYKRCIRALQPIKHYAAEQFPFAVAADAVSLVFEEMIGGYSTISKPVSFATQLVKEIDYTYDETSMRQWWSFTTAAQEMAWLQFDKNRILGTAIYTSEDPYVRSTAYLVAESLNMEPAPLQSLGNYNPFTDQEANERLHNRACEESFQQLIAQLMLDCREQVFIDITHAQNMALMEGYPLGWCEHSLRMAFEAFQNADTAKEKPVEKALQAYNKGREQIDWESLRAVCKMVMHKRRDGEVITPKVMASFTSDNQGVNLICKSFENFNPEAVSVKKASTTSMAKKYIQGNISSYMHPSAVVVKKIQSAEPVKPPKDEIEE